jgi:hypothetical protein
VRVDLVLKTGTTAVAVIVGGTVATDAAVTVPVAVLEAGTVITTVVE